MMVLRTFFSYIFFALPVLLFSQNGLEEDLPFFQERMQVYQRWLDHTGLGQVIRVHTVELDEQASDTLSLYLSVVGKDTDYMISAWEQLKKDFEARSPMTLEQQLFFKMTDLMDLDQSQALVQIYDTYDLAETPCFFIGIYYDEEVRTVLELCKSESRPMEIPLHSLKGLKTPSVYEISSIDFETRREIYQAIIDFAEKEYFAADSCRKEPEFLIREIMSLLRFEVRSVCSHAIKGQHNNLLCRIYERLFSNPCSTIKRERLTFIISVDEQLSSGNVKLNCEINGFYSDSWLSTGRGAYKPMEGEFDDYLKDFADFFSAALGEHLMKGE